MIKEAQAGRAFIESALAMNDAAIAAGVATPRELEGLIRVGRVVADFVRQDRAEASPVGLVLPPQFEKVHERGEHIITMDVANRLEWDVREFDGREFNHVQAEKACAELRTGGHTDWRLPGLVRGSVTVLELETIRDLTKGSPAINKEFFPHCRSAWYRTSVVYAPLPGFRWGVHFGNGGSDLLYDDYDCYVRAVRASQ